jgi:septum formation protein
MDPLERKIILASKSPRRKELLSQAGFNFEIRTQDVDEDFPDDMPVEKVAPFLARKKAAAMRASLEEDEIILTADSVVILDGVIFNKPADEEEARRMLRQLSGNVHQVITGVCLMDTSRTEVLAGKSDVHFMDLSRQEIDFYIRQYQPFDKAGSYGIQEWLGLCKIKRIEGTYANVMGLPVHLVYEALSRW